ncbi:MAG TPA: hypothetical protein DDW42_03145, partial [Desulfobacteraceae bacterium]|nr:hypothetical protein [Desulfobacteraceae bacterium]
SAVGCHLRRENSGPLFARTPILTACDSAWSREGEEWKRMKNKRKKSLIAKDIKNFPAGYRRLSQIR